MRPPTIDAALKAAYDTAAIYYPFTDLVVADPFAALTDGAILAFYIGQSGVVGGTKTDMVAWANDDVFLQIWIGADDKLPRRIRAIYRTDPLDLRHEMELSNWQLDGPDCAGRVRIAEGTSGQAHRVLEPRCRATAGRQADDQAKSAKAAPAKAQPKSP